MSPLEQAADAVAVRPGLWHVLGDELGAVLRSRIQGQAYTAIAQTKPGGPYSVAQIKELEATAVSTVMLAQRLAVRRGRWGIWPLR